MAQIRIIAGSHRSRLLKVVDAKGLRPTGNRLRELVFNWLGHEVVGSQVLDLYAGSGALGFEAASRGAKEVVLVDNQAQVVEQLRANQGVLKFSQVSIVQSRAVDFVRQCERQFDLIFLDPPFSGTEMNEVSAIIGKICTADGFLYREYDKRGGSVVVPDGGWELFRQKSAGEVCIELWRRLRNAAEMKLD